MARISPLFASTRILFLASLAIFLIMIPAQAEEAAPTSSSKIFPVIAVRAGVHPDFDRVVFDWPHTVAYAVHRDGTHVTIRFASTGKADFREISLAHMARARDFSSTLDAHGHLTVSFSVGPHAVIKDFLSGASVVIDIRGAATVPPKETAQASSQAPSSTPSSTPSSAPPAPTPAAAPQNVPDKLPPVVTAAPTLPSVAVPPPPPPAPAPETPPAIVAPTLSSPSSASAVPSSVKTKTLPSPDLGTASQLVAALDPHIVSRAAVFQRAGYAYIVFDRKFSLDLPALTSGQPPALVDLEPLDLPKASGWRFPVPADAEIRATREDTAWHIFLSKQHIEIPVSTALVAQPDFALGSRYLLPLPDAPEPVSFTDPAVGDRLILIPLAETEAFSVARRMADFRILPAAQGLVIEPLTDKVVVRNASDGIEITAEGGLHLSRSLDTGAWRESVQKAKAAAGGKSLFDLAAWRGKPNETFTETRQRLQQTIVDVPDAERNRARLELARFYFANGDGEEASALLHYLVILVPDLTTHADFMALIGAAKILAYQPEDGLAAFENYDLKGQPEIELWEAIANAELRNWQVAEEKFSVTESILAGYPEPFYSRFSVLAVESALAAGKDREAKDWLDRLENSPHRTEIDPAIEYLHGVIYSKENRAQAAEELWREVADSNDRLYRIRAELALVDLEVATGALTPAKAADRLEAMRFGWRGDDLELDILHRLGQFYIQSKNVKGGLAVLDQAVQLYPKSPLTPQIRTEMAEIFRGVFLGDLAPNLSAVEALTLYQEYRELMPTGADGDAVMRNLAERLVAIDLLDQAAGLLEELVKNHLQGVEKGRVGTRLAAIRLLDHKPSAAMAALDMSNDNNYPADLLAERQLLRAKALSELDKGDNALELLKANDSKDARMLRADIFMHAQRWADAAKTLLDLIGPPPKAGDTLTKQQADWLVSCAIALSLANDQDQLNRLAVDFSASMAAMPQNDTFRVLTQPEKATQPKDIGAVQSKISEVDLFRGFLNAYRAAPSDNPAATTAAAPPAGAEQNGKP
jgi:hypothetical protein